MPISFPVDINGLKPSLQGSPTTFYPYCFGVMQVVFDGLGSGNSEPTQIEFTPRSATVNLNGFKEADTFELEIDGKLFPLSPEMLKNAQIELYMFHTDSALDEPLVQDLGNGKKKSNLSKWAFDTNTDGSRRYLLVAGLIDEATLSYTEDGQSFRVTGRDYTALLLGKDWPDGKKCPIGQDLSLVVQNLVNEATVRVDNPNAKTLTVVYLPPEEVETDKEAKTLTQKTVIIKPPKGAKGSTGIAQRFSGSTYNHSATKKKAFPVRSGKTYWDVIYDLCIAHNKIAFVRGTDVVISDPHTLTQASADKAIRVAYGRNLRHLSISRNLGRQSVPQIIGSVYSAKERKSITAKWPRDRDLKPTLKRSTDKGKGAREITGLNTVKEMSRRVIPPQSITDFKLLEEYLKSCYDAIARHESKVSFATGTLSDLDGRDMLQLRPGDPVKVEFDTYITSVFREVSGPQARYDILKNLGYSDDIASLVAFFYDSLRYYQAPIYVTDTTFGWDKDSGISVEVSGFNYFAPKRDDVSE